MHIIAADVGGTKTRLVFADADDPRHVLYEARYASGDFDSFEPLLKTFINDSGPDTKQINTLTLALPGLVEEDSARLTNLPWVIEKQSIKDAFGINNVHFINDFQASAFGTSQLMESDRIILNPGSSSSEWAKTNTTHVAVGAGTGLGVAWAQDEIPGGHRAGCAYDTEGGHIDFAPVDETQIQLLRFLQQRHGHVSYERILSGSGLVALYEFFADLPATGPATGSSAGTTAQWVNENAESDSAANRAVTLFVQIYGAYIGNIALLFKPFGGIFITGGIAAKMLQKMQSREFLEAYLNKGRMRTLSEQIPVYLVTNERIGVLGAMSEAIKRLQVSK